MGPPVEVKRRGKPRGMRRDRDCLSCKQRNVKCDLNRPSCTPCLEAKVPCAGYPQRVIWTGDRVSKEPKPSSVPAPSSTTRPQHPQSPQQTRRASVRLPSAGGSPDTNSPQNSPPNDVQVSQSTSRPPLKLESPSTELRNLPPTDQNSFITSLVAFCQHIMASDGSLHDGEQRYLSVEAVRLVSQLHDLMKARMEGRRSVTLASGESWDSIDTARHRLAVLIGLNEALEAANPFAFLGIAAFAVLEVCDSPFGEWQRHLHGARSLLDYHCPDREALEHLSHTVTGLHEIVARLVWFDTLGAITRGTTGLIFDDWHRQLLGDSFFHLVGCTADSFELFNKVAKGQVAVEAINSCMLAMDQLSKMDFDMSSWGLSANVNRCAAAIAVLTQLDVGESNAAKNIAVASAVDRICQLIAAMAPSSQYYIHVAVPAYLSGMNATSIQQCHILRTYWNHCNSAGVRRYPDGLAKCEERWKQRGLT